jgi:hypothetical protein
MSIIGTVEESFIIYLNIERVSATEKGRVVQVMRSCGIFQAVEIEAVGACGSGQGGFH